MQEQKITVKSYMTKKSTPEFDFMKKWNNDIPMPLRTMIGTVEKETRGMVYMKLHADITDRITHTCMKCGRPITNPISQYFGMGPECGGHNYVNPFRTEAELRLAVEEYRKKLRNITWEGWIIRSAIDSSITIQSSTENSTESSHSESAPINVSISIEKSVKCNGNQALFLEFDYNDKLINHIRSYPTRYWDADKKRWELPISVFNKLTDWLDTNKYTRTVTGNIEEPKPAIVSTDYKFKTKPFAHQTVGFNFGLMHDRWLLGDEQGLGKTKQVIDIACAFKQERGYKHCLIVCGVNGLKWNWMNEVATHSNETSWILGMKSNGTIGSNARKLADLQNIELIDHYFLITNVETLRDESIAAEIQKLCNASIIGLVAIDEIHKCKNPSSQQGKGILKIQPEVRIAMTGTPMMNHPLDLYIIMKWLGYERHSFYAFKNHYCVMGGYGGYEILGYKNLQELQEQLDAVMLRRLKDDVFDLPDKIFVEEYVEMTPKQSVIYREATNAIKSNIDQIKMSHNPLAELIRLRQATGYTGILSSTITESAKLDRMEELVEEAVDNGKKVVIFSNWTQITDEALARLSKHYDGVCITGDTPDNVRQQNVDMFQTRNDCKFIIGTIGAMGTGLTLTAGTIEIFLDEPWNRALKDQAVDRCHRIGTTESVTIYTLMCKDTIDERIHNLVEQKGAMSDALIDGKITKSNSEILEYLLG